MKVRKQSGSKTHKHAISEKMQRLKKTDIVITFFGKILKILAALAEVIATNCDRFIAPDSTPFSQTTDIRSSTPFTP